MKCSKISLLIALCFFVFSIPAYGGAINVVNFDVRVCRDGDFYRIDGRLRLRNMSDKAIRFEAMSSPVAGIGVYPWQMDVKFCDAQGNCIRRVDAPGTFLRPFLDVSVRGGGEFLLGDELISLPISDRIDEGELLVKIDLNSSPPEIFSARKKIALKTELICSNIWR